MLNDDDVGDVEGCWCRMWMWMWMCRKDGGLVLEGV